MKKIDKLLIEYKTLEPVPENTFGLMYRPEILQHKESVHIDMYGRFMFHVCLIEYRYADGTQSMQLNHRYNSNGTLRNYENNYNVFDRHHIVLSQKKEFIDLCDMYFYVLSNV